MLKGVKKMRLTLIELRKKNGLSQKNLADTIGVSRRQYCAIENASRNPSKKVIDKLEDYFNVPQRELLKVKELYVPDNTSNSLIKELA